MPIRNSRREFLAGMGALAAASLPGGALLARSQGMKSPFRVAVISDEITQDFGRACEIASREFGMEWIELRGMWGKNLLKLDSKEVQEAQRILEKYKLRVTDIASPLFKVDWPGAPQSKLGPKRDQFNAEFTVEPQAGGLEGRPERAHSLQPDRVLSFDFVTVETP